MKVLGIGCHPDDLEIACFGTLAKYAKLGHDVAVCHIANGNLGHVEIPPDALCIAIALLPIAGAFWAGRMEAGRKTAS